MEPTTNREFSGSASTPYNVRTKNKRIFIAESSVTYLGFWGLTPCRGGGFNLLVIFSYYGVSLSNKRAWWYYSSSVQSECFDREYCYYYEANTLRALVIGRTT